MYFFKVNYKPMYNLSKPQFVNYAFHGIINVVCLFTALCRRVALRHTGIITATCLVSPYIGVTNTWFALESLPLNIYFMYLG